MWYVLLLLFQKELLSYYTNVNIQQAIAVGTTFIQVMEASGVSNILDIN